MRDKFKNEDYKIGNDENEENESEKNYKFGKNQ